EARRSATRPDAPRRLQRFRTAAVHGPTNRADGARQGRAEGGLHVTGLLRDDDTRHAAQHDLDAACSVDAALRSVHVLHAYRHALDVWSELAEACAELRADRLALLRNERRAEHADVRGHL